MNNAPLKGDKPKVQDEMKNNNKNHQESFETFDECNLWEELHEELLDTPHPELTPEEISEIFMAYAAPTGFPPPRDGEALRNATECPQLHARLSAEVEELCKGEDLLDWEGEWTEEEKAEERKEHYWDMIHDRLESMFTLVSDTLSDRFYERLGGIEERSFSAGCYIYR